MIECSFHEESRNAWHNLNYFVVLFAAWPDDQLLMIVDIFHAKDFFLSHQTTTLIWSQPNNLLCIDIKEKKTNICRMKWALNKLKDITMYVATLLVNFHDSTYVASLNNILTYSCGNSVLLGVRHSAFLPLNEVFIPVLLSYQSWAFELVRERAEMFQGKWREVLLVGRACIEFHTAPPTGKAHKLWD